jgi:hypothetical protein
LRFYILGFSFDCRQEARPALLFFAETPSVTAAFVFAAYYAPKRLERRGNAAKVWTKTAERRADTAGRLTTTAEAFRKTAGRQTKTAKPFGGFSEGRADTAGRRTRRAEVYALSRVFPTGAPLQRGEGFPAF